MSVSDETLELMKAAARNGSIPYGKLVRSKLTNLLLWKTPEHEADDLLLQRLLPALFSDELSAQLLGEDLQQLLLPTPPPPPPPQPKVANPLTRDGRNVLGEIQNDQIRMKPAVAGSSGQKMSMMSMKQTGVGKHEKENATATAIAVKKLNWQDQWEALKKAGQFCNFCKKNKEVREIYQSHDLKGPDGEVTCPVLKSCVCQYCGEQGHTM